MLEIRDLTCGYDAEFSLGDINCKLGQGQILGVIGPNGSGKTTFLVKLLSLFSSQKCGVLMNEFGEIGIDGLLLPQKKLNLIEINGGSIFCQCRNDSFIEALISTNKPVFV